MQDVPPEMGEGGVSEDWREDAACRDTDPDTFYPDYGVSSYPAKRICDLCDVRAECLDYACEHVLRHQPGMSLRAPARPDGRRVCMECNRQRKREKDHRGRAA